MESNHNYHVRSVVYYSLYDSDKNALRPSAVIIVYQKFRQVAPTSLFITYTLHPLPDRDRSRVANAG
jgi:hypothetical protein